MIWQHSCQELVFFSPSDLLCPVGCSCSGGSQLQSGPQGTISFLLPTQSLVSMATEHGFLGSTGHHVRGNLGAPVAFLLAPRNAGSQIKHPKLPSKSATSGSIHQSCLLSPAQVPKSLVLESINGVMGKLLPFRMVCVQKSSRKPFCL